MRIEAMRTPCIGAFGRHVSGTTLPRFNFCIAAEELQPIALTLIALEHSLAPPIHFEQQRQIPQLAEQVVSWPDAACHCGCWRQQGWSLPRVGKPLDAAVVARAMQAHDQHHDNANRCVCGLWQCRCYVRGLWQLLPRVIFQGFLALHLLPLHCNFLLLFHWHA